MKHDELIAAAEKELDDGFSAGAPSAWVYAKHVRGLIAALRSCRERTIEECAKVCDETSARHRSSADQLDREGKLFAASLELISASAAVGCAAAIRSLSPSQGEYASAGVDVLIERLLSASPRGGATDQTEEG